ncbi:Sodium-coupled monocarboxylate transporter 1, partial [Pseudolycoriella hygida]
MPITVLGPSLAVDQVTGFGYEISSALIFLVCIAYSSLAVLWTDVLQTIVMMVGLVTLMICGVQEVGGFMEAWKKSEETGRINFFNFDPDPRNRHTFWSATIGGFFVWLPLFGATQAQIQRYNSVPTLRQSTQCLVFNMFGMIVIMFVCSFIGLIIYGNYYDCDPVAAKIVSSADQLLPLFVVDVLRDYPGLSGLLVAGLTCGTLSTVSSCLNSLTALITEDFVKKYRPEWDEIKLGYVSKIISTVTGLIAFALVFVVRILNYTINISPFSTLIHGSLLGPILGAFTLGMFLPWVNNMGILLGMFFSILFSGFFGLGSIIAGIQNILPNQRLNLTLEGCVCSNGIEEQYCRDFPDNEYLKLPDNSHWKDNDDSVLVRMLTISYIWQPGVGTISTIVFGIFFSALVFGESTMQNWIDYDDKVEFITPKGKNG